MRLVSLSLCSILLASTALAGDPQAAAPAKSPQETTLSAVVQKALIAPLRKRERERSKFSRAPMPPSERRVHMTDAGPQKDASGKEFVAFTVQSRYSPDDAWDDSGIEGCMYTANKAVYVKRGDEYRTAAAYVGTDKKDKAAPEGVCAASAEVKAAS